MAKTMARIESGAVVNLLWCSDRERESTALISIGERPVAIGDTYENGKFYRDGEEVLTPLEEAQRKMDGLDAAYQEGVNSV